MWLHIIKDVDEDAVFKALADPTRRLILDELAERPTQTLYELCARLIMKHQIAMSRQAIAKHLSNLEKAGLIHSEHHGKYRVISFENQPIIAITKRWYNDTT